MSMNVRVVKKDQVKALTLSDGALFTVDEIQTEAEHGKTKLNKDLNWEATTETNTKEPKTSEEC